MIVVRDIFQLKFGKAKEALALWKEGLPLVKKAGHKVDRLLTDLAGPYYTLVLECIYQSLADYETAETKTRGNLEWANWYQKLIPLVDSGRREILTIVD